MNRARRLPVELLHADWSVAPEKRQVVHATLDGDRYRVSAPRDATSAELVARLARGAWAGFDFPLGLPRAYAARRDITSFTRFLEAMQPEAWRTFASVAAREDEVSLERPFYPRASGGKGEHRRAGLARALGLREDELYRRCDREGGRPACPVFWTLGSNQVGKGALTGWDEVVRPALAAHARLWPFDGAIDELLATGGPVLLETYPGDAVAWVGAALPRVEVTPGRFEQGKRSQASRRASAPSMLRAAEALRLRLEPALVAAIRDGFGGDATGEDRFDAYVGAAALVAVVTGARAEGTPDDAAVRSVEGWILGRAADAP